MLAYLLDDVNPASAAEDPKMRRLLRAGPWQYQPQASGGTLATWKTEGNLPRSSSAFGTPRKTTDGMMYFPPKVLPRPEDLLRANMQGRDDLHKIDVETENGVVQIFVLPAYASPRTILDNNLLGPPVAAYAKKSRALLGRLAENPDLKVGEVMEDLCDVCREALMHTMRCTPELISDCGWLTEDSTWEIWKAVRQVPKELSESGSGP